MFTSVYQLDVSTSFLFLAKAMASVTLILFSNYWCLKVFIFSEGFLEHSVTLYEEYRGATALLVTLFKALPNYILTEISNDTYF